MQYYKVSEYSDLPEQAQVGHDLREGLKQLRSPRQVRVVKTRHGKPPQEDVHPVGLHQAFRYGIPLEDRENVVGDLRNVIVWIDKVLT
jgi:hypothetical protein